MRAAKRKAASQDTIDLLRLIRTEGVGPVTFRRLLERFGSAAAALDALPGLTKTGGRETPPAIPDAGAAEREIERTAKLGGRLIFLGDPDYPPLLAMLDDAPACLAVLGDAGLLRAPAVAIVGGRNASANGQRMAETLSAALAATLVVVSGLARGIDAAAHKGAMTTGKTVAAIASGLDVTYPPGHEDLQRRIAEAGAVVTEAPPGTEPQARHFPRRNRVIAGLSLGVVVVEAASRSGSLITASLAQDAGREIFCCAWFATRSTVARRQRPAAPGRRADRVSRRCSREPAVAAKGFGPTAIAAHDRFRGIRTSRRRGGNATVRPAQRPDQPA